MLRQPRCLANIQPINRYTIVKESVVSGYVIIIQTFWAMGACVGTHDIALIKFISVSAVSLIDLSINVDHFWYVCLPEHIFSTVNLI